MASAIVNKRKQITMTSLLTTPTNPDPYPDHMICQWIQIWIHCETESRFGQIEYGLIISFTDSNINKSQNIYSLISGLFWWCSLLTRVTEWAMINVSLKSKTNYARNPQKTHQNTSKWAKIKKKTKPKPKQIVTYENSSHVCITLWSIMLHNISAKSL